MGGGPLGVDERPDVFRFVTAVVGPSGLAVGPDMVSRVMVAPASKGVVSGFPSSSTPVNRATDCSAWSRSRWHCVSSATPFSYFASAVVNSGSPRSRLATMRSSWLRACSKLGSGSGVGPLGIRSIVARGAVCRHTEAANASDAGADADKVGRKLESDSLTRIAEIVRRYEEASIPPADAALAHLAERENIRTVLTLDRRDSSMIGLKRNRTLKLLPDVR